MALSGSLSTNKYSGIMGLKFSWTAGAQSIVDNETPINWTLESDGGSGYSYYTGNLTLTIDGSTALSIPSKFLMNGGGAWKRTGTLTLKHNDDGKRSFSVSIAAGIYTYGAVNCTASTTFTLDQILRRSVVSGVNGTLGSSNTLTLTRYNSAFTDTITATCGTASMTIATGNAASSVKWTPPVAWAAQNVSATSVTVTISCKTYSGSTLLGETTTTLTFAIPASVVPTVSLAVSDAKGYLEAYGSYIQNKSQAKVTASGEGVYGSTIQRYSIVCGSLSGTGASGTFDLPKSGTITIKVTATDSRGRSASASIDIEVTAYSAPVAEITSRYRCDADGNEDYLGAYAIAVFNAAVTSLGGKNGAAYALKYRIRGTAAWTSIAMEALTGNYAPAAVSQIFPADIDYSYDICIETTDNFGTVESAYRTIQMGSPIMDADRNNRALAFFQRAVDANTVAFGEYVKFNAGTNLRTPRYNLLDNSDFTNPVNQRGAASYDGGAYMIDRWRGAYAKITVNDGSISILRGTRSYGLFIQFNSHITEGKTYTFAAKNEAGEIAILTFSAAVDMGDKTSAFSNASETITARYSTNSKMFYVGFSNVGDSDMRIVWTALYEGEYTAETLPEYQPKGYGMELAECRRYFKRIGNAFTNFVGFGGILSTANKKLLVTIPGAGGMRTTPTVTASGVVRCFSDIGSAYEVSSIVGDGQDNRDVFTVVTMAAALDGGKHYLLRVDSAAYIDVSADL